MRVIRNTADRYDGYRGGYHIVQRGDGGIELHHELKIIRGSKVTYYNKDGSVTSYPLHAKRSSV